MKCITKNNKSLSNIIFYVFILLNLFIQLLLSQSLSFDAFKYSLDNQIINLAQSIVKAYSQRCNNSQIQNCQIKSYNYCQGTPQKTCLSKFAKPRQCSQLGARLSLNSAIRYPNFKGQQFLTDQQKIFTCSSASIQKVWTDIYKKVQQKITFQYFASISGAFKAKPSFVQKKNLVGQCPIYDPRTRPWYASGVSTSKNILIFLPFTGAVFSFSNLQRVKQAANTVISTLTTNDFFNIILYKQNSRVLDSSKLNLNRATQINTQYYKKLIDELNNPSGFADFKKAFTLGFQIIQNSKNNRLGAPCPNIQNIFLFFADSLGKNTQNFTDLYDHIQTLKKNNLVTIFTYQLPTTFSAQLRPILKHLACSYNGIYFQLDSNIDNFVQAILSYYLFISQGINKQSIRPAWSRPYTDSFGFGRLVTVLYPGFINQAVKEVEVRKLIGIAGMDVKISFIQQLFPNQTESSIQQKLINTVCANISTFRQDSCKLQRLRPQNAKCSQLASPSYSLYQNCSSSIDLTSCPIKPNIKVLTQPIDTNVDFCCTTSKTGVIIGAIVGGVIGVLIILIIIYCIYRKYCKKEEQQNQHQQQQIYQEVIGPGTFDRFPKDGQILTSQQRQKILDLKFASQD